MANVPAQYTANIDIAFASALVSTGLWPSNVSIPFSLSALLNSIDQGSATYTSLTLTGAGTALTVNNNALVSGQITAGSFFTNGPSTFSSLSTNVLNAAAYDNSMVIQGGPATSGTSIGIQTCGNNFSTNGDIIEAWYPDNRITKVASLDLFGNFTANGGILAGALTQVASNTAMVIKGKSAATPATPGIVLDNITAATSGKTHSFRSGGIELANIDFSGTLEIGENQTTPLFLRGSISGTASTNEILTISGGGIKYNTPASKNHLFTTNDVTVMTVQAGASPAVAIVGGVSVTSTISEATASTALTLEGNGTATGKGVVVSNVTTMTSGGEVVSVENPLGTPVATIDYAGNLVVSGTATINGHIFPQPLYLVPEDANVTEHVNAADMYFGTAKVGTPLTKASTPGYVPNLLPRPGTSLNGSSTYYTLANGVLNVSSTWTCTMLIYPTSSLAGDPFIFGAGGDFVSNGFGVQISGTGAGLLNAPTYGEAVSTASIGLNALHVLTFGYDGASMWMKADNASAGVIIITPTVASGTTYIGAANLINTLYAGDIVELYFTTTAFTPTLATNIYNSVIANQ